LIRGIIKLLLEAESGREEYLGGISFVYDKRSEDNSIEGVEMIGLDGNWYLSFFVLVEG